MHRVLTRCRLRWEYPIYIYPSIHLSIYPSILYLYQIMSITNSIRGLCFATPKYNCTPATSARRPVAWLCARSAMLRCRTTPTLRGALRRLSTFEDVTPMTIADRVEQAAVRKGAFAGLRGRGKPLPEEDPDSQVHVAQLSKNIEGRVQM